MTPTTRGFLYVAIAWILAICYSVPLVVAAESIIDSSNIVSPDDVATKQIMIFLYGLGVVGFLGGSQIPGFFLKRKSYIVQFAFSTTFGLFLLLITTFRPFDGTVIEPLFKAYPLVTLEYLSIPYLVMVFLDFHSSGRLKAFSWRQFGQILGGTLLRPRRTFEDVNGETVLFSFAATVLVSVAWIARSAIFTLAPDFQPARSFYVPPIIGGQLDLVSRTALIIPAVLSSWVIVSALAHSVAQQLGGNSSYANAASLLGLPLLPSLMTIVVDLLELGLGIYSLPAAGFVFFALGFFVPLVLWPTTLAALALQSSKKISFRSACLTAVITFLPLFNLLSWVFL